MLKEEKDKFVLIVGNESAIYGYIQIILILTMIILLIMILFKGSYNYAKIILILVISFVLIFDLNMLRFWCNVLISIISRNPYNRISYFTKILFSFPQINLIHNMNILKDINYPVIYLANYPITPYEYLLQGVFPNSIFILGKNAKKYANIIVGSCNKYYFSLEGNSYDIVEKNIVKLVGKGKSIFAYIEKGCKPDGYKASKIRSGLLHISKNNNIPIVLVIFDHFYIVRGIFPRQNFRIKVFKPTIIRDVEKTKQKIQYLYNKTLTFYKKHKINHKYKQYVNWGKFPNSH